MGSRGADGEETVRKGIVFSPPPPPAPHFSYSPAVLLGSERLQTTTQLKMTKLNAFRPSEDFILLLQTSAPSATGMNSNSSGGSDFLTA